MRIALLGATGYIGRSLLAESIVRELEVVPVTRDQKRARETFEHFNIHPLHKPIEYETLLSEELDMVINAAGIGSPSALKKNPSAIFDAVTAIDALVFSYLEKYPQTKVYALSSGAVFGRGASAEVTKNTLAQFDPYTLLPADFYGIAKLCSEAQHRAHTEYAIVDLRIFAFFSAYAALDESFFLAEVMKAIVAHTTFLTNAYSMIRDCITTEDLLDLILFLQSTEIKNGAFDVVSKAPFEKFEFLRACAAEFQLEWRSEDTENASPTGKKNIYASTSDALEKIGFTPAFTSTEGIFHEMRKFVEVQGNV